MLSKRWLINYLLIVLICIFTFVGNRYQVITGYQPKNSITSLKLQDIHSATIQTTENSFVLRNSGGQWLFEKPLQWPANNITLERLISIASSETDSTLPAEEIELATLGLQSPKAVLTLNDTRVAFGATNNIGGRRYIMIGSTVYLLPDIHLHFMTQGIVGLIDRRLIPGSLSLNSLKLAGLSLRKDNNGSWQGDGVDKAAAAQINQLANNWQTLDAGAIKIYDKSEMPRQKIIAGLQDGSEIEFFLMSIEPEIVIARPDFGVQYHFAGKQYYDLLSITENFF